MFVITEGEGGEVRGCRDLRRRKRKSGNLRNTVAHILFEITWSVYLVHSLVTNILFNVGIPSPTPFPQRKNKMNT